MNPGLSLLRFALALTVVLFHLWPAVAPGAGRIAVVGFFFISGFLITAIARGPYHGRRWAFLKNRFLRIWPTYLTAIAIGFMVVRMLADTAKQLNPALIYPTTFIDWLVQLTIFGLYDHPVRLSPPTWSLNTELYFYLAIGLFTAYSAKITRITLWITCMVAISISLGIINARFYGSPIGNAFVFFAGSWLYFRMQEPAHILRSTAFAAAAVFFTQAFWVPLWVGHSDLNVAFSLLPLAILVAFCHQYPTFPGVLQASANLLGRLAYPLFLLHWAGAAVVTKLLALPVPDMDKGSPELFFTTLPLALLSSYLVHRVIERPLEAVRARTRQTSAQT